MAQGVVTFAGKSSNTYGMRLLAKITFETPGRDYDEIEVPGRNGSLLIDRGRYKTIGRDFDFVITKLASYPSIEAQLNSISNWLNSAKGWQDLTFDGDPDYTYRAAITSSLNFDRESPNRATGTISFIVHPVKFLNTGRNSVAVTTGLTLVNPYAIESLPKITINGTGGGTFNFCSTAFRLQNVTKGIVIDVQNQSAISLNDGLPAYSQVLTYPFPTLVPGDNKITFPAGFSMSIIPNWGVLV